MAVSVQYNDVWERGCKSSSMSDTFFTSRNADGGVVEQLRR